MDRCLHFSWVHTKEWKWWVKWQLCLTSSGTVDLLQSDYIFLLVICVDSIFSTSSLIVVLFIFLVTAILRMWGGTWLVVLICIYLITSDAGQLSMCLLIICYLLWRNVYSDHLLIFQLVIIIIELYEFFILDRSCLRDI